MKYLGYDKDNRLTVRIPFKKSDGKWSAISRRVTSENEALEVIRQIKSDLGLHGAQVRDIENMTMRELMARYSVAYPNKPKWYTTPVLDFLGDRKIRSITYGDLREFKFARERVLNAHTGKPRCIATINRELEVVRSLILYAFNHGWLKFNVWKAGPPLIQKSLEQRRTRIPSLDEEERLIAACVDRRAHIKLFIIATLDTGLRKSALQDLIWKDVLWNERMLSVPTARFLNKQRPPLCGLSTRLFFALREAFELSDKKPDSKIFPAGEFKGAYQSACEVAGIEGLRFNDLRHGYATKLMQAGVPQHLAMKMAGHTNAEIHGVYCNVNAQMARDVANQLDRFHEQRRMMSDAEFSPGNGLVN